jgi:hypothetical protein
VLKFLRKFRKKFKTACLTAALVTCWQVGQAAKADTPNWGDEVTVKISGSISLNTQNLSHLFLIYGTSYSGMPDTIFSVNLGEFSAGKSTSFDVSVNVAYNDSFEWYTAGLYGDISSGQYIEGVNGVNLGTWSSREGHHWDWLWDAEISEQTVFNDILNGTPESTSSHFDSEYWNTCFLGYPEYPGEGTLFNFSQASNNGQINFTFEVVPEPVSIILFGTGGLIVAALRRRT